MEDKSSDLVHGRRDRLMAKLSGFFGLLATLIAAAALYGVTSYLVAQPTNEIGIRMALGARRIDALSLVLRKAASLLASGLILGATLSLAVVRAAKAMLFGLKPTDPAMVGLGFLARLPCFLPARRAMRVDAIVAFGYE